MPLPLPSIKDLQQFSDIGIARILYSQDPNSNSTPFQRLPSKDQQNWIQKAKDYKKTELKKILDQTFLQKIYHWFYIVWSRFNIEMNPNLFRLSITAILIVSILSLTGLGTICYGLFELFKTIF